MTTDQRDTLDYAWRIEAGERATLQIPILSEGNSLFPVTGWTVDAKIKTRPGGPVLHTFPPEQAHIFGGGAFVELVIPAATSAAWVWRTGWWRLVLIDPTNPDDPATYRLVQGPVVVDPD